MSDRHILIRGARTNNLRGVDCAIPHGHLTVITGVSGSGKSSLAFNTLFAEGQRRFVESMSTYARQFLDRLERPDVDFISHIPPAIALEQRNAVRNARSTIGTATEINDVLRLVFAKIGRTVCPDCGIEVQRDTVESARDALAALPDGTRLTITAPLKIENRRRAKSIVRELIAGGFHRVLVATKGASEVQDLAEADLATLRALDTWPIVIDRVAVHGDESATRIAGALEQAFKLGQGRAEAVTPDGGRHSFTSAFACTNCGREFREPEPNLLSFNSPLGACPECNGFGRLIGIDFDRVIPNPALTLDEGAIAPWNTPRWHRFYKHARERTDLPFNVPIKNFTAAQRALLTDGDTKAKWAGIRGHFKALERKIYKMHIRVLLSRYRGYTPCPACSGMRLRPDALLIRVGGRNIAELCAMSIEDLRRWFDELKLSKQQGETAARPLTELHSRLRYLDDVGLGYLTLARQTRTLSGGESQRINLAAALGSNLTATLYVLDEPTVGLHARDTHRLLRILHALRANGNTVVIIEHDPEVIRGADHIIDLGPGAGERGGEVLFQGTVDELASASTPSLTSKWLNDDAGHRFRPAGRPAPTEFITVHGASGHNLRDLTVEFPKRRLVCVSGVSGSGKSTLVVQTLVGQLLRARQLQTPFDVTPCRRITGADDFHEIILMDQSPLQRSARSNPVTYTKAYDEIRKLLAADPIARARGIEPGHFSFNTDRGRCEACEGLGVQTIDMHFLADVQVTCEMCEGRRFKSGILDIRRRGRNIHDILNLTVDEAAEFFSEQRRVVRALQPLRDVGLGYLRLGQSTATLSGGEAQRLRLASHLTPLREGAKPPARTTKRTVKARRAKRTVAMKRGLKRTLQAGDDTTLLTVKPNLFVFDEPTTGLHLADVDVLLSTLDRLVEAGHSVIVIEHSLEVIRSADWVIDLGPEGGDQGGRLLAAGPPSEIAKCKTSHTGAFLRATARPKAAASS